MKITHELIISGNLEDVKKTIQSLKSRGYKKVIEVCEDYSCEKIKRVVLN